MFVFVRRPKSGDKEPVLLEKTISQNGEYLAEGDEADGYSKVTVDVPAPVNKLPQVIDKSLQELTVDDFNGVTKIEYLVFNSFTNLKSVVISDSITEIGAMSFRYCTTLRSVIIGNGVTRINSQAFYGSASLLSITIKTTVPPILQNRDAFDSTNNCPIYVPAASVDAYKAATNWSSLASRIFAIQE